MAGREPPTRPFRLTGMKKQRLTSASLSLLTLTVLPFAAACGSEKAGGGSQTVGTGTGSGTSEVTGIHWTVDDLTADGKKSQAPASAWLKIDKNGKVSGNLGCNGFGAEATVDGDEVSFAELLSTDMGCANDPMAFEGSFSKALKDGTLTAKATEAGAKNIRQLTLTTKSGDTIHLTEEKAAPSTAPSGRSRRSVPRATATARPSPPPLRRRGLSRPRPEEGDRQRQGWLQQRFCRGNGQRRRYHFRQPGDHPKDVRRLTHGGREGAAEDLRREDRVQDRSP